jgi:hypothetical protein
MGLLTWRADRQPMVRRYKKQVVPAVGRALPRIHVGEGLNSSNGSQFDNYVARVTVDNADPPADRKCRDYDHSIARNSVF